MSAPYRITHSVTHDMPADVTALLENLCTLKTHAQPALRDFFDEENDLYLTRAPGRLDLMGGIADYSGSLVLQLPIAEATLVALQLGRKTDAPVLKIVSLSDNLARHDFFEMPLADFMSVGRPVSYENARAYFRREPARQWAAYVAGAFLILQRECGIVFEHDARLLISSSVPAGKGVSSSAALEVATMSALCAALHLNIEARRLALLCQQLENLIVGAPCGVMDQMTSACGEADKLLALLCQPAEIKGLISLPPDVAVWGLDSGVRHSVGAGDYGSVRVGAFMGYRLIAEMAGLKIMGAHVDDPLWHGFLANLTPSEYEQHWASRLPERITGREFIERYGATTDPVTSIDPEKTYAVRTPTAHPIYENFRVRTFAALLQAGDSEQRLKLLGELMYQSHASYSACGLGSAGTDRLVELVRKEEGGSGLHRLYGAKITGGGSGGTVAVLGRKGSDEAIHRVAEKYAAETGFRPHIFTGSSPGSAAFGYLHLRNEAETRL